MYFFGPSSYILPKSLTIALPIFSLFTFYTFSTVSITCNHQWSRSLKNHLHLMSGLNQKKIRQKALGKPYSKKICHIQHPDKNFEISDMGSKGIIRGPVYKFTVYVVDWFRILRNILFPFHRINIR